MAWAVEVGVEVEAEEVGVEAEVGSGVWVGKAVEVEVGKTAEEGQARWLLALAWATLCYHRARRQAVAVGAWYLEYLRCRLRWYWLALGGRPLNRMGGRKGCRRQPDLLA